MTPCNLKSRPLPQVRHWRANPSYLSHMYALVHGDKLSERSEVCVPLPGWRALLHGLMTLCQLAWWSTRRPAFPLCELLPSSLLCAVTALWIPGHLDSVLRRLFSVVKLCTARLPHDSCSMGAFFLYFMPFFCRALTTPTLQCSPGPMAHPSSDKQLYPSCAACLRRALVAHWHPASWLRRATCPLVCTDNHNRGTSRASRVCWKSEAWQRTQAFRRGHLRRMTCS